MRTQKPDTKGLNLSPILDNFQQNPDKPDRFTNGCPGSCTNPASKMVGLISFKYVQVHMRRRMTVMRLGKLKIALMVMVCSPQ
mmetsp:Transcript_7690/g.11272  ORF Transcript_7690/g.11272 Transcript_7690/m.11272 type:complete len:83 (-) Transcript_7690:26-274(-)